MKRFRVRRRALDEAKAARDWYRERDADLAARFLVALDDVVEQVKAMPGIGSLWPGIPELRRARVRGFPYWVVYEDSATEVLVVAVAHERRRPNYWLP